MTQELKHLDLGPNTSTINKAYTRMDEITVKNEAYLDDIRAMKTLELINERIKYKARTLRNSNEAYLDFEKPSPTSAGAPCTYD